MSGEKSNQGSIFFFSCFESPAGIFPCYIQNPWEQQKHMTWWHCIWQCAPTPPHLFIFACHLRRYRHSPVNPSTDTKLRKTSSNSICAHIHVSGNPARRGGGGGGGRQREREKGERDREIQECDMHTIWHVLTLITTYSFTTRKRHTPHLKMIRSSPTQRIILRYYWEILVCKLGSPVCLAKLNY